MLSADAAFEAAANAAAAAFSKSPPLVRYHVHIDITRVEGATASDSIVVLRNLDGVAVVKGTSGTTSGDTREGTPPALPIAVDPLAEWGFHLDDSGDDARLRVAYEHPKTFSTVTPAPGIDVHVTSVRGYRASYAQGEANHVRLEPATEHMISYAAQKDDFVYRDVFFDPITMLPTRVVLAAPGETLTLDFGMTGGAWLLTHLADSDQNPTRFKGALRTLDATYDQVSTVTVFPEI